MKRAGIISGLIASGVILIVSSAAPRAAAPAMAGDPVKGKVVYTTQKCNVCHMPGSSAKIGPDLSNIGNKRDAAWLAKYLPNPTPIDPKNKPKFPMKPTTAKGQDLDDLIAYLLTLKK